MAKQQRSATDIFMEILGQNFLETPNYTPAPTPKSTALAQYLMSHNKPGPTIQKSAWEREGAQTEEPGLLSKIFDTASAPLYGAYGVAESIAENIGDFVKDPGLDTAGDFITDNAKAVGGALVQGASSADTLPGVTNLFSLLPERAKGAAEGFAKEHAPKRFGSDILGDMGVENKIAKYGGGFALDVAADPLTYVPGLNILGTIRKGKKASDAILDAKAAVSEKPNNPEPFIKPVAPEKPAVANMAMKGGAVQTPSTPPVAPPLNLPNPVPKVDPDFSWGQGDITQRILNSPEMMQEMKKAKRSDDGWRAAQVRWKRDPDVEQAHLDNAVSKAEWSDKMKQAKMAKRGVVRDGKGDVSQVAITRIIEDIQRGNIPSFGRIPPSAAGSVGDFARKAADDHITAVMGKTRTDHNPANQANLYNRLYATTKEIFETTPDLVKTYGKAINTPRARKARRVMARAMLRTAEDHMIKLGAHPVYWDGTRLRLSDILEEVGLEANDELATKVMKAFQTKSMKDLRDPAVARAINLALARRPLHMSTMMEELSERAKNVKDYVYGNHNLPQARELLDNFDEVVDEWGSSAGLTKAEIKAAQDLVRNIVDVDDIPIEKFATILAKRMREAKEAGRMDSDTYLKMNKELTKILGQTKNELMYDITGNKVVDGFFTRVNTAYGRNNDMKRMQLTVFGHADAQATALTAWLRNMVKGASNDEIIKGFMIAQGKLPSGAAFTPKENEIAAKMSDYFETMLSGSGFKVTKDYAGTVAERSYMVMEDLNKYLKAGGSRFQFTNESKVKDFMGVTHDYSAKGEGWLNSWKLADPNKSHQNPVSFLYDLDLAMERTIKEYALIDEFGRTFGVTKDMPQFNPKVHTAQLRHSRIPPNVFFDRHQRDMMQRLLNDMEDGMWSPQNKLIRHYSRGIRAWKTGVTIYMPSHHIRNMIGDLHLMWWAGHNDPRNFTRAKKILHTERARYKAALQSDDITELQKFVDPDMAELAKATGDDIILKQKGTTVNARQFYMAAHQRGLLPNANKLEDIFGEDVLTGIGKPGTALNKITTEPLGGKGHHAASQVSEYREHYVRMSHYVGAVNKELKKGKSLKEAFDRGADEVRKWHPDGRDLTRFEHKVRLFAVPFYSWTRKAVPLIVEAMVQRPAKVLYYPRAQGAFQGMMGIEQENPMLDPFPENQLFPEWIRAKGIGPIGDPESDNPVAAWFGRLGRNGIGFNGQEQGYTVVNPSNPFNDVVEQIGGFGGQPLEILKSIFDSSGPATKIPVELMTDRTFSGAPISADKPGGQGVTNYLLNQVPILSAGNNVAEIDYTKFARKEAKGGTEPGIDIQALINYLTAAGIRGTGGSTALTAEFEASDRARMARDNG